MKRLFPFLLVLFFQNILMAQTTTDHIHIDQFGYLPSAQKVAVISNPQTGYNSNDSYTPGAMLELVNEATGAVAFSAAPVVWESGATHGQSGDQGWWFDFSSVNMPGDYFIRDASNNTQSYTFKIDELVYSELLKVAGRMFYYNRCNAPKASPYAASNWTDGDNFRNPLQDANCRFYLDPNNAALEKDLTGGWFDAGDYNKYVTFASTAIHDLLNAYEENIDVFGDDWNIPESGNGFPDIIDEIKWELDWLKKMQNADGSVHIKMGSISFSENASSPPSANTDPRYYGPTCSSAAIALAAMFAHAALVFENISGLESEATNLETLAELSWNHVLPQLNTSNLDVNCDDGTIKAGDADRDVADQRTEALLAAFYLFKLTGASTYGDWIINNIDDAPPVLDNWLGINYMDINKELFVYTQSSNANTATKNEIINSITPHIEGDWNGFFGMNEEDLYRSFMPDWSYDWGSCKAKAQYGTLSLLLKAYGLDPSQNASFEQKAEEQLHYFHGVNPQNLVYLSNMYSYGAEKSANEIYHTWFNNGTDYDHALTSLYGPAPGYVVGGANGQYTYTGLTPPYNQPLQKSYLDFNDGFPMNSWEITEPAIYYQASYIRLLANYAGTPLVSVPITLASFKVERKMDDVQIDWQTMTEVNSKSMELERSTNGMDWTVIETKDAAGNSTTPIDYEHLDVNPWNGATVLYYRLKLIDLTDQFSYSPIRSVERNVVGTDNFKGNQAFFHPNPVSDFLNITFPKVEEGQILIYDGNGLLQKRIDGALNRIDVADLVPGMYFLKLNSEAGTWKGRFVKI